MEASHSGRRSCLLPAATGPYRHQRHSELARPPRLPLAASPGQAAPTLQPRGLRVERVGWSLLGPRSSRAISLQLVAQGVGLTRPTPAHSDILHPRALCSTSSTLQGVLAAAPQTNLPTEGRRRPPTGWLARPPDRPTVGRVFVRRHRPSWQPPPSSALRCRHAASLGPPQAACRDAPQGPASRVTRADVARALPRKTTDLVIL